MSKTTRSEVNDRVVAAGPGPEEMEARRELAALAGRRTGAIPPEVLVDHVSSICSAAPWPVTRAAMEAVLLRLGLAGQEELSVAKRPPGGSPFGQYAVRPAGAAPRPYVLVLERFDPLRGRCDCRDFLRNSLGLCKHLLCVLSHVASHPRLLARARRGPADQGRPRLTWDPVRPIAGEGDWLERVEGVRRTWPDDPRRRLALVQDLHRRLRGEARRKDHVPDPALCALVAAEKQRLQTAVDQRSLRRELTRHLESLKKKLYPFQLDGVRRFWDSGRLLLADDMGLGKTAQALAICHALMHAGRIKRGLVIAPASLKAQWYAEWQRFTDVPVAVVEGSPPERRAQYASRRSRFLICNYEQVIRDLEWMADFSPGMIVLDEAQRIKNWRTKTARAVKRLEPTFRLVLTGTPMENRLEELASLLDWLDDFALEPKWRLEPVHSVYADGTKEVVGARQLDTLRARLARGMVRRVRREVLDQLPERTDVSVPVAMTPEQVQAHEDLRGPIASLMQRRKKRPLTQAEFLKLMQLLTAQRVIANGMAQIDFPEIWPEIRERSPTERSLAGLASPKLSELREIVEQVVVQQGRKAVLFSQWRRMLTLAEWAVRDILAGHGLRAVFFTGQEKQRRRTQNIVEFHDDPDTRVFLATDAGGVGLNLQRASNCIINLDLPWNPAVLEQRIGRVHRLGQTDPIDVFKLVSSESIEERIAGILADKKALFAGLFDGSEAEVSFERSQSIMSRLELLTGPVERADRDSSGPDPDDDAQCEADLEETLARADEAGDPVADGAAPEAPEPRSGEDAAALMARLAVRRTPDGHVVLDAPPEAAAQLASVLEGLAGVLREAARGGP